METPTALPPIARADVRANGKHSADKMSNQGLTSRLESIKDLVRIQGRRKQRRSVAPSPTDQRDSDEVRNKPPASGKTARPRSVEGELLYRHLYDKHSSVGMRRKPNGDSLEQSDGSKRLSYPPSDSPWLVEEHVSNSLKTARLRRDMSRSCPMLCDLSMFGVMDIGVDINASGLSGTNYQKTILKVPLTPIPVDKSKAKDRANVSRVRGMARGKKSSSKQEEIISSRPPKPPSWQSVPTETPPLEPETKRPDKILYSLDSQKRPGSAKHDDSVNQRPPKPQSWHTSATPVGQTEPEVKIHVHPQTTDACTKSGNAKSEESVLYKQPDTSFRLPKPPSWQTVPTEAEDIPSESVSGKHSEKSVPTVNDPSPAEASAPREVRCHSARSSRTAKSKSPTKFPEEDEVDVEDTNGAEALPASSVRTRGGLRRANIKRTRSRVIDAREIPDQEQVIPLSQTKPSEFHLRKTHHDNDVYLSENTQRCRQWLAGLREETDVPSTASDQALKPPRAAAAVELDLDEGDDLVTCDLELTRDKWMYVGSPYPSSSSEDD